MSSTADKREQTAPQAALDQVAGILQRGLAALAETGEVDAACRLAGEAYAALWRGDPANARRFNVLLHRLTPKLTA